MNKERNYDLNYKNKLSRRFKISSAVLVISSSLIGSNIVSSPSIDAEETPNLNKEQNPEQTQQLQEYIQKSREQLNRIKGLETDQKEKLNEQIGKAQSSKEIDNLLKQAENDSSISEKSNAEKAKLKDELEQQKSDQLKAKENAENLSEKNEALSTQTNAPEKPIKPNLENEQSNQDNQEVEEFVKKIENTSNKVDEYQRKEKKAPKNEERSNTKVTEQADQAKSQIKDLKDEVDNLAKQPANAKANSDLNQYVQEKEKNLNLLASKVSEREAISKENKARLENEIEKNKRNIEQKNDMIANRLKTTSDKQQAVKDIIGDTLNDKETQGILKHIDTKGKTDQQITSQVVGELDKLSSFSSDGLLESMFAKADNRKDLIEVLLSPKFEEQEARNIAEQIMRSHPDNAQLVKLLKQHYGENISGDDILEDVLDRADNKQKAIETILASKLNDNKARILANKIAAKGNSKAELLKLMKSDADTRIDQLLKLDHDADQMKSRLHRMFNPLNSSPGLLAQLGGKPLHPDLLNGHSNLFGSSSLLDKLLNGKSLLDDIPDIPNPSQGHALSLGDSSDDFLSGLFDHEGNFDLPKAGEAAKKVALPFGASMIIVGGGILWYVTHRKRKLKKQI